MRRTALIRRTLATAAGAVIVAGCHPSPSSRPTMTSASVTGASPVNSAPIPEDRPYAAPPIPDATLASAINARLARDPLLERSDVHVTVTNGNVKLSGTVPTLAAKWRASQLVSELRGADSLVNDVLVNTPPRPDSAIAKDVNDAIAHDPATRGANVRATCDAEVVTIHGAVDSSTQRELLGDVAARVPGVQQVILSVALSPYASRGDTEIAADVRDELRDDAMLDGTRVNAAVHGRDVILDGVVGSLAQRDAAIRDAWVSGVGNVDAQAIRVDWRETDRARPAHHQPLPSDEHVATAVRRALSADPRIGIEQPAVAVERGVVTLSGNVADLRAGKAAAKDARRVRGTWRVDDRITVLPVKPESDSTIERQVRRSIYNDLAVPDSAEVRISVDHGRVQLRGAVASIEEKKVVESDAEAVPGVVAIRDDVRVEGYGPQTESVAPARIRARVEENLFWDPRLGLKRVSVDVTPSGDVTLTGTVDGWGEARAATDDAIRGGAARVINRVRIAGEPGFSPP